MLCVNILMNYKYFTKVFLDEINTATCLGLFKELIMDKTLNGEVKLIDIYAFAIACILWYSVANPNERVHYCCLQSTSR